MSSSVVAANHVLGEIFKSNSVRDISGNTHPLNSDIGPVYADALYRMVLQYKPRTVVEIGMAYGISSLAILTGLRDAGGQGKLISVDPYQSTSFLNIGIANVQRSGMAEQHQLIESADYLALPGLLRSGIQVDFAYVDGTHSFDYVLLDFFYLDKMLHEGGVIGFNDCGYRAIHKVLRFVARHRKYQELNAGLKLSYKGRNPAFTFAKFLTGRSNADRYFKKVESWEPAWNFYARF